MLQWIVIKVLLAALGIISSLLAKKKGPSEQADDAKAPAEKTPFKKNKYFLSTAEQVFFRVLKHVVDERFEVLAKVRLLDLLWLPPQAPTKQKFRNMAQSKHADFVLCDPKTLVPVLVVELDDSSHQRADRQDGDAVKNRLLEDAGLPILRVKCQQAYDTRALAEEIQKAVGGRPTPAGQLSATLST